VWTLSQRRLVNKAIKEDACLLCRTGGVNEAALCDACYALLNDDELRAAERWLSGVGP
jgi:hypothetical protein